MRRSRTLLAGIALLPLLPAMADGTPDPQLPSVDIVGLTPVLGTGVEKDKVPSNVQSFSAAEIAAGSPLSLQDSLSRRVASVADYQGNELQASLALRGFNASPVLGESQGLAVYQNGMRLNEAFGDLMNWDLQPSFAIAKLQVLPGSNPVFGLNALGGAVSLQMKTGFDSPGGSLDIAGGPNGRGKSIAEVGGRDGQIGYYAGVMALNDDGWRNHSPSRLLQGYGDLAWRGESGELHAAVTLAASYLGNNGGAPREMLDSSWASAFTVPDNQRDNVAALDLRGSHDMAGGLSLQGSLYFRHLRTAVENGNTSNFQDCGNGTLCDGNSAPLTDLKGNPIATPPGLPAQINSVLTVTDSMGGAAQLTWHEQDNVLVAGVEADGGRTRYLSTLVAGAFDAQRIVYAASPILGGDNDTALHADNLYGGLYATDTLSLTPSLALTLAGRYNAAELHLHDETGTSLNGEHLYFRFNPSAGLAWQIAPGLSLFGNYSEANRVPTPAELSCADLALPCRVPNAFAGDPGLKQVVSHSVELGARGAVAFESGGSTKWSVAGFYSRNRDDIIFVTAPAQLTAGFFQNAGTTQRAGLEAFLNGRSGAWQWFAAYTMVRATFETAFEINNPSNPGADGAGNISVRPGDVMPGMPTHSLKLGVDYDVTSALTVGGDLSGASGAYLRGDEANLQAKTAPYAVLDAEISYRLWDDATLYLRISNLLDRRYASAGIYSDGSEFGYPATDRFLTPGAPRNGWLGMRMTF